MKNTFLGVFLSLVLICHVWTAPIQDKRQVVRKTGIVLNSQTHNMKSAEHLAIVDDKKKQVLVSRPWQSFINSQQHACFAAYCQGLVSKCKKNKSCKAALVHNFPKNGIRAKNFKFVAAQGWSAVVSCKNNHLAKINAGCPSQLLVPTTHVATTVVPAPPPKKTTAAKPPATPKIVQTEPSGNIYDCKFVWAMFTAAGVNNGYAQENFTYSNGTGIWPGGHAHLHPSMGIQGQDSWAGCMHRNGVELPQCLCQIQGAC